MRIVLAVDGSRPPSSRASWSRPCRCARWSRPDRQRGSRVAPTSWVSRGWPRFRPDADRMEDDVLRIHRSALDAAEREIRCAHDDLAHRDAPAPRAGRKHHRRRSARPAGRPRRGWSPRPRHLGVDAPRIGVGRGRRSRSVSGPGGARRAHRSGHLADDGSPSARTAELVLTHWPLFEGVAGDGGHRSSRTPSRTRARSPRTCTRNRSTAMQTASAETASPGPSGVRGGRAARSARGRARCDGGGPRGRRGPGDRRRRPRARCRDHRRRDTWADRPATTPPRQRRRNVLHHADCSVLDRPLRAAGCGVDRPAATQTARSVSLAGDRPVADHEQQERRLDDVDPGDDERDDQRQCVAQRPSRHRPRPPRRRGRSSRRRGRGPGRPSVPAASRARPRAQEDDRERGRPADQRGPDDRRRVDDRVEPSPSWPASVAATTASTPSTERQTRRGCAGPVAHSERDLVARSPSTIRQARRPGAPVAGSASSSLSDTRRYSASG